MATKKSILLERLAKGRAKKAAEASVSDSKAKVAPKPVEPSTERDTPADAQREIADACAKDAMIMGWDRAVQKHAYENRISEDEMRRVLDQAEEYNEKADPSGRIPELEDWKKQKQGRSDLASRSLRPS